MVKPILFSLFGNQTLIERAQQTLDCQVGTITLRQFPDEETYFKIHHDVADREVIIIDNLYHPNSKVLPLIFAAATAKDIGAKRVGLVAPYLAYMRQDKRFQPGEGITSNYFAALLSHYFDWLVTVDPHLHRHHRLGEIYTIPTTVIHAASSISHWINAHINQPILIGPDSESEQWVANIAKAANAPYIILKKVRRGDREVEQSALRIEAYQQHTPVLVDDIISSGQTMIATMKQLKSAQLKAPICIGIHAAFAHTAFDELMAAGAEKIVTCNTIDHPSNCIDLAEKIITAIRSSAANG